jgi:hypothetical protein
MPWTTVQHIQLVNIITHNALTLVQDPYGNYVCAPFLTCMNVLTGVFQVVQYILHGVGCDSCRTYS